MSVYIDGYKMKGELRKQYRRSFWSYLNAKTLIFSLRKILVVIFSLDALHEQSCLLSSNSANVIIYSNPHGIGRLNHHSS